MQIVRANIWGKQVLHYQELKKLMPEKNEAKIIDLEQTVEIKSSELDKIRVKGGNSLNGKIKISGAKNSALKLMCASLLTAQPIQIENMPVNLRDIKTLAILLRHLGVTLAMREDGVCIFRSGNIKSTCAPYDLVRKMRASVLVLGPLLSRFGHAKVSLPGGCAIGSRPVDAHIKGLEAMGADISIEEGYIIANAPNGLKGCTYKSQIVSVGATENLMMAATLAKGTTILENAAQEPEISDLGNMLIKMGAKIEGLGTDTIKITGVPTLTGAIHSVLPDRIEAGTWAIAAIMTDGNVELENVTKDTLGSLEEKLIEAGAEIQKSDNSIKVRRKTKNIKAVDITTMPHPGFPTDLQAQFMSLMTLANGTSTTKETIFENRFMHVPELNRMGANISISGNTATIKGIKTLKGAEVMATDLRASVALVLAGMMAEGETIINRIYHLERGYEKIVEKLTACGIDIEKVKITNQKETNNNTDKNKDSCIKL